MGSNGVVQSKSFKEHHWGHQVLGTLEFIAAVATMSNMQKADTILLLDIKTEALAGLPDGRSLQTIVDVKALLKMLAQIEPNVGANPHGSGDKNPVDNEVPLSMLPKFENFSGKVHGIFKFIEEFKMKAKNMAKFKKITTFIALGGIAIASWFKQENFVTWDALEEAFKQTWCIKLNLSGVIAPAVQTYKHKDGYI